LKGNKVVDEIAKEAFYNRTIAGRLVFKTLKTAPSSPNPSFPVGLPEVNLMHQHLPVISKFQTPVSRTMIGLFPVLQAMS